MTLPAQDIVACLDAVAACSDRPYAASVAADAKAAISRLTADNEALRKELRKATDPKHLETAIGKVGMVNAEWKARADALAQEVERKDAALWRIAEGNLGGVSWQANYDKIREVALADLGDRP